MSNSRQKETRYLIISERELQQQIQATQDMINRESIFQFSGSDPVLCSHFSCARHLSLVEQLAGSKCTQHMNIKPIHANLIISI